MKKLIIIIIALGLIAAGFYFFARSDSQTASLSNHQEELGDLWGRPAQFEISYLPQGKEGEFVRSETWYYPATGKAVSFLGGQVLAAEDFSPPKDLPETALRPEDFTAHLTLSEVASLLGDSPVLFDFPGFSDDGAETYLSSQAIFVLESGYLTYFKTIGLTQVPEEE